MMPLSHHLGAHQDICFLPGKGRQNLLVAAPPAGGIMVQTQNPRIRKESLKIELNFFGAPTRRQKFTSTAGGALIGNLESEIAIMAFP